MSQLTIVINVTTDFSKSRKFYHCLLTQFLLILAQQIFPLPLLPAIDPFCKDPCSCLLYDPLLFFSSSVLCLSVLSLDADVCHLLHHHPLFDIDFACSLYAEGQNSTLTTISISRKICPLIRMRHRTQISTRSISRRSMMLSRTRCILCKSVEMGLNPVVS